MPKHSNQTSYPKGVTPWIKGKCHSEETKIKIRTRGIKRFAKEEERLKLSKAQLNFLKHSKHQRQGHYHSETSKQLIRARALERFKRPGEIKRVLLSRRPTDLEAKLIEIITKYHLPYKYVGNGDFIIGGKNPDFINTNSAKVAIDIFGDHWHNAGEIPNRKAVFAKFGWELIILWGHELKHLSEIEIVNKIYTKGE